MGQIIKDTSVFTYQYIPFAIPHREKEIRDLSLRLNKPLEGMRVINTIIYGLSGTGKTLISKYLADNLQKKCPEVKICYVRLKRLQTEYKAINKVAQDLLNEEYIGHSPDHIYNRIFKSIKQFKEKYIVFIFDEIDSILENYDNFLDAFLRPNENYNLGDKQVSTILISNNMTFPKELTIGTKSSFSCIDKLVFSPYNANQLRDVLIERAEKGLNSGTYSELTIPMCAALGAQEHGDARRTIELLGKSAFLAENDCAQTIEESHIRQAQELIEFEGIAHVLNTLPVQSKATALAIVRNVKAKKESTTTTIHSQYKDICHQVDLPVLSQRRIHDILVEFENIGLINTHLVYRGGGGRSRYVDLIVPASIVEKVITDEYRFQRFKPLQQELDVMGAG